MHPEFDAHEVWQNIDKHKVNLIFITGDAMGRPMLDALIAGNPKTGEPYDLSTLYVMASSAALFSPSIQEQFLELLPNRLLTDSIGSSETGFGGLAVLSKGQKHDWRSDGQDRRLHNGSRRRRQRGRTRIGQASACSRARATSRSATTRTRTRRPKPSATINGVRYSIPGDYAQVEADGTVTMLGRGSVSINSGGEKVYPEEVEGALKAHPDIFDVLVVGIPDERFGQRVAAVVQVREGTSPTSARHRHRSAQRDCRIQGSAQRVVRRPDQAQSGRQARLPLGEGRNGIARG